MHELFRPFCVSDYGLCVFSCESEEVTQCSTEEIANQPVEVIDEDDGRGQDDGYDREKIDTRCSTDTPQQLSADKEISGNSDFVENDFDSKVSNRCC